MKRIAFILIGSMFFSMNALAENPTQAVIGKPGLKKVDPNHYVVKSENGFYFKPGISIEYSAPVTSAGGPNADFKTNNFGKQVSGLENLALGFNVRVQKYLGGANPHRVCGSKNLFRREQKFLKKTLCSIP
jgi:hypothetical protein